MPSSSTLFPVLLILLPAVPLVHGSTSMERSVLCQADIDCHVHAKCNLETGVCVGLASFLQSCDHEFDCASDQLSCILSKCLYSSTQAVILYYVLPVLLILVTILCLLICCCRLWCKRRRRRRNDRQEKQGVIYQRPETRAPDSPVIKSAGVRIAPLAQLEDSGILYDEPSNLTVSMVPEPMIVRGSSERRSSYDRVIKEYIEAFSQKREMRALTSHTTTSSSNSRTHTHLRSQAEAEQFLQR